MLLFIFYVGTRQIINLLLLVLAEIYPVCSINAKGKPFKDVKFDFDFEARHASTPDIGADEFTPLTTTIDKIENHFNGWTAFPNPSTGNFVVSKPSSSTGDIQIIIVDLLGKEFYRSSYSNIDVININTTIPAGMYLLTIATTDGVTVFKIGVKP